MRRRFLATTVVLVIILTHMVLVGGCTRETPTPTPSVTPTAEGTPTLPAAATTSTPTEAVVTATPTLEPQVGATPTPAFTATLRVGWLGSADSLRPLAEQPTDADAIVSLVYDRLIYHALDNTYAPALARSWASPDGGKTWTFSLAPNVVIHDGQPLAAEDVAFSLQLYRGNPKFNYYGGQMPPIERIQATGATTLTITMTRPVGNPEALFHWMPILPKRIWATVDISDTAPIAVGETIGSGPFIWKEPQAGQPVTLLANKGYWMGAPELDAVSFHTYPNADALAIAIQNGEVDLITEVPLHWIADLRSDPLVQVVSGLGIQSHSLLFNVSLAAHSTGHPALRDPQVRLAIAHAIDKQQLIDVALLGWGMPGLGIIPPALHQWFNPGIQDVAFDLDMAQLILEDAGYRDTDSDGVREMPASGQALDFRLFVPQDLTTGGREAEMISNWLRQIGINVSSQMLELDAIEAACCPTFDYDILLWERGGGPDPGFLLSTLTTAQIDSGLNETGYSNPAYDALYDQQAIAVDQELRRQIVQQMQQIAFTDRPSIVLYYDVAVQAFRKDRFQNWLFVPGGILSLADERSLLQVEPVP